ncbi:hypothetical protein [Fibrella forsythiae]|uniref:Uncharacterized protein n=1 Tax=Fibrella forsythiae TaxID=2817061 RepID=A0ABS3JLV8_9BACT|nr:hypothetical protein [Fibrella forsythiae]MBO0950992.1 hypothetical protein [Fibrella forsythiae]
MTIWLILLYICLAGTMGGIVNALINRSGFELPKFVKVDGVTVYKPGLLGNMLVSSAAAGVSWGLYGPLANYAIGTLVVPQAAPSVTIGQLMGAVLVGTAGAKWFTSEIDRETWRATAVKAASQPADATKSKALSLATPMEALNMVK